MHGYIIIQTTLEYRSKLRPLRVRTLDEAVRRVFVDDSHCVQDITRAVCARIGGSLCAQYVDTYNIVN